MEKLQQYLRQNGLEKLASEYSIKVTKNEDGSLASLTYSQIDSPKTNEIVWECRGTIVKTDTFEVVGRSFKRFFNYGENPAIDKRFNWDKFVAYDKEDGSLIILYYYNGEWRVNTKGSFGLGKINDSNYTWKQLFFENIFLGGLKYLDKSFSYSLELCSLYNKVVRTYTPSCVYLLAAFHNATGMEKDDWHLDLMAEKLGCKRPRKTIVTSIADIKELLENEKDPTFEGVVLFDGDLRSKLKRSQYLALHRLANNGNLASDKNLIPIILGGEVSEIALHFAELVPRLLQLSKIIWGEKANLECVYQIARNIKNQKEFAAFVLKYTKAPAFLFEARKKNYEVKEVWNRLAEDFWIKHIEDFL